MNKVKLERLNNKRTNGYYDDEPKEYNVSFIPHKSGTYRVEIDSGIESVSQFSTAIQVLGLAKEDDDVEVYLQSCGGLVDASGAFIHAMRKCAAPIHIVASGGCHSAATHILLHADSFELAENFNSLIHNGSSGSYGNINEYVAQAEFDKEFIYKQYQSIYEGFLDPVEFDEMMKGKNIWLDAQQWCERCVKRQEHFRLKLEKLEKQQKAACRKKKNVDTTSQV